MDTAIVRGVCVECGFNVVQTQPCKESPSIHLWYCCNKKCNHHNNDQLSYGEAIPYWTYIDSEISHLDSDKIKFLLGSCVDALLFYGDPESYRAIAFLYDSPCGEFGNDFDSSYADDSFDRPMPGARARNTVCAIGKDILSGGVISRFEEVLKTRQFKSLPSIPYIEDIFTGQNADLNVSKPLFIVTNDNISFVGYRDSKGYWHRYREGRINETLQDKDILKWSYCEKHFPVIE